MDTVPPPAGEVDAYSAATQVRDVDAALLDVARETELAHQQMKKAVGIPQVALQDAPPTVEILSEPPPPAAIVVQVAPAPAPAPDGPPASRIPRSVLLGIVAIVVGGAA